MRNSNQNQYISKWFRFKIRSKMILINFDLISDIEIGNQNIKVGEWELIDEDAERFMEEFERYNNHIEGLVRVR